MHGEQTVDASVAFITMGCAKNEVDSEHMLARLMRAGYSVSDDPERADVVIVNTCSFIQAATEESIEAILEVAGYESVKSGRSHLVVAGCMPARYGDELTALFDRADLFCLPGTGGLALQQAMASALPLIAAEADGTQADLVRPENGIQVRPGDPDELSGAITRLLSDPVSLRKMGAESFRIVRDEINLEAMAAVFTDAAGYVIKNGRRH